jgi:hypothetical protein
LCLPAWPSLEIIWHFVLASVSYFNKLSTQPARRNGIVLGHHRDASHAVAFANDGQQSLDVVKRWTFRTNLYRHFDPVASETSCNDGRSAYHGGPDIGSLAFDHFGPLGVHLTDMVRLTGAALVVLGVCIELLPTDRA